MPLTYPKLHRRCQAVLEQIDFPYPFSITAFCEQLARRRQRPLHLRPLAPEAATSGICGLWLATPNEDHIFFEQRTVRLHQEHIVLHELGHMLFEHRISDLDLNAAVPGGMGQLFPDLHPRLVQRLLARSSYTTRQEREAEMLASLIRTSHGTPSAKELPDDIHGRLRASLGVGVPYGD